jgi:hypothetical protein
MTAPECWTSPVRTTTITIKKLSMFRSKSIGTRRRRPTCREGYAA